MNESESPILQSLRYYDNLRLNFTGNVTREAESNVDVLQDPETGEDIFLCHLSGLLPFTFGDFVPSEISFLDASAVVLAAHQLNVGDGSILPILNGLNDRCKVRFTTEFADTQFNEGFALNQVVTQIGRKVGAPDRLPCAFLGAYGSAISIPTSIVTGLFGFPQVSGSSTSSDLEDTSQHGLFARTIPSDTDNSIPTILYLREVLQVTKMAVIHVNDPYGNAFNLGLRNAAREYAPDMKLIPIPLNEGEGAERIAIEMFQETGYLYAFCLVFTDQIHDNLMTEAYKMGLAGNGKHTWFFGGSFVGTLDNRRFEKGSVLDKAYHGVGLIDVTSGFPGVPTYDLFAEELGKLKNAEDLQYLGSLFPKYDHPGYGSDPPFIDSDEFLSTPSISNYAPFLFDATIALGLAACSAISSDGFLDGHTHFRYLAEGSFTGVSGKVSLDAETGTRDVDTATYLVYNFRRSNVVDPETGEATVEFIPYVTDIFENGNWSEVRDFIFNDDTANLPPDYEVDPAKAEPEDWAIRILVPVVIAVAALIVFLVFIEWRRKKSGTFWYVKEGELTFSDPPEIIGRGKFGLILKAEYRETEVAIKRVIPPRRQQKKDQEKQGSDNSITANGSTESQEQPKKENLGLQSVNDNGILVRRLSMAGSVETNESNSEPGSKKNGRKSSTSISSDEVSRKQLRKKFIKEMRVLSKLRHSCIATVVGVVLDRASEPLLVMEYMDHGSLYDLLHNSTLQLENIVLLSIIQDIAQGVRFLHSSTPQVVHGDLKSANILVDARFRAKVSDFGLFHDKDAPGCTGTPYWMAPELLRGESGNTSASDVYSFGIILYEIYSRQDPYEKEDPASVLHLVVDELVQKRPPIPQSMPPHVQLIMKDAIQDNADSRPSFKEINKRLKPMDIEDLRTTSGHFSSSHFSTGTFISLFDIFPKHVAQALREGRTVEPEHRDMVTIFFSDIVGYTQLSANLPPRKVALLLNRLYTKFDALSQKHDVFKVETIGDAYMAVTNLVKDQEKDHAKRVAEFAIDAIREANETLVDEEDPGKGYINIRVGFHSGSVVADVVGTRNPRYCLFGDSVDTASRMENSSKANRIHCSIASAEILAKQCPSLPVKSRGLIPIKGKGEMQTCWVNEGQRSGLFVREDFEEAMIGWAKEHAKRRSSKKRRSSAANFLIRPLEVLNFGSSSFDKTPSTLRDGDELRKAV